MGKDKRKIWQVKEISGKGWGSYVVSGQTRYVPALSRKEAKELYTKHYKKYPDTTLTAIVIHENMSIWEGPEFPEEKKPMLVRSVVLNWLERQAEIVDVTNNKYTIAIDTPVHVRMLNLSNTFEEKDLLICDLDPYMMTGYIIESIQWKGEEETKKEGGETPPVQFTLMELQPGSVCVGLRIGNSPTVDIFTNYENISPFQGAQVIADIVRKKITPDEIASWPYRTVRLPEGMIPPV